jgi:hypothetical protein
MPAIWAAVKACHALVRKQCASSLLWNLGGTAQLRHTQSLAELSGLIARLLLSSSH